MVQHGEEKVPSGSLTVFERGPTWQLEEGISTRACSDRTRGNGFTLKEGRFRLDGRKNFFL